MSTGDLSVTAEMSVEIETSPDRSTCYSADPEQAGNMGDSDYEADGLSNLEEENNDENDDVDSQASDLEEAVAFHQERRRRMNR